MSKERVTYEALLKDQISTGFERIEKTGTSTYARLDNAQNRYLDGNNKTSTGLKSLRSTLIKVGAAGALVFGTKQVGEYWHQVAMVSAEYEKYDAVLTNTLRTTSAARDAMGDIVEFASTTPFQVNELTSSYVKLVNQGFKPSMDEMRNMGDLAASTGKSFDQLTEAVIDAQTGEFERLKEFGIRAKKQGDKVTFTFKGQQKQVDFTAESIQQYVLGLGKAAGVAGAMNKIAKTQGGLISNLGDEYDILQKNLGDRLAPATKKVLKRTISLVGSMNDLIAIPVSEKMEDERREANYLAAKLSDTNLKEQDRAEILTKLQEIAPDIVDGLNDENIATGKLLANLRQYNDETIKKIALARREEKVNKLKADGQEDLVRAQEYMAEVQYRAFGVMDKIKDKDAGMGRFIEAAYMGKYNDRSAATNLDLQYKKILYDSGLYRAKNERDREIARLNMIVRAGTMVGAYNSLSDDIGGRDLSKYLSLYVKGKNKLGYARSLTADMDKLKRIWGISDDTSATNLGEDGNQDPTEKMDIGLGSVKGDNRKVTNLTINIEKQIETVEIHEADMSEGGSDGFIEKLRQALFTVVNDVNYIAE